MQRHLRRTWAHSAESALAQHELLHRLLEVLRSEIRPTDILKAVFCVCALPEEKVTDPALATRANHEIHGCEISEVVCPEVLPKQLLTHF
jgi:hypothetical protein